MGESRDVDDPRDAMRGMRKEAREEFERQESGDTGGQEHASRAEREGVDAAGDEVERTMDASSRVTEERSDADASRVPREAPIADAGGVAPGPPDGEGRGS